MSVKKALCAVVFVALLSMSLFGFKYLFWPKWESGYVLDLNWSMPVDIEAYYQIRVTNSSHHPPDDAYDISDETTCLPEFDPIKKTSSIDCSTEYSWAMDRWVVVRQVVFTGNYQVDPVMGAIELNHVEQGYGNERIGGSHIDYHVIIMIGGGTQKTCSVNKSTWDQIKIEDSIQIKRNKAQGHLCSLKLSE